MRRWVTLAGFGVASAGLWMVNASAEATSQPPPPTRASVGVSVDSLDGLTETTINCGRNGWHGTVNGDGTLFMENRPVGTITCRITTRYVG
jgi:hypothetical protein